MSSLVSLQTPVFFMKDQAKSVLLQLILIPPIFLGLLYTIQLGGRAFFIYAWLFLAAVTFVSLLTIKSPATDRLSPTAVCDSLPRIYCSTF